MKIFELTQTKITPADVSFYRILADSYGGFGLTEEMIQNFDFIKKIREDCQPYIKEAGSDIFKNGMWRGIKGTDKKPRLLKTARLENRTPTDMPVYLHGKLNEYFDNRFGHPYRNGVFVTGDQSEAMNYGEAYQIFPIGEFDYLWSPDVDDLMTEIDGFQWDSKEITDLDAQNEAMDRQIAKFIKSSLRNYKNNYLGKAVQSHTEIMLWTKQYYAIHEDITVNYHMRDAYKNIIRHEN